MFEQYGIVNLLMTSDELFKVTITIPHIDESTIPQFEKAFINNSYIKSYWRSFVFPNKVDYTFSCLTNEGVKNILKKIRVVCDQIFENEYKKYIYYTVENTNLK